MAFERPQLDHLLQRFSGKPINLQILAGPRQVGKTTLAIQLKNRVELPTIYVTADEEVNPSGSWVEQQWQAARVQQANNPNEPLLLIIDEIQKVQDWSERIKKLWDEDRRNEISIHVLLTGSSRMLLQKGLSESLAGRFEWIPIYQWTYSEMKEAFGYTPEEYVWFGGYPGAAVLKENELRWKNYVLDSLIETTLSRDILMLSRIEKPALLRSLFEVGSDASTRIISFNKLLGQLQDAGNTVTLSYYLELLDTAGLLAGLEKIYEQKMRRRGSSPKFQVFDTCLQSVYSDFNLQEALEKPEVWGHFVESAVGAHLIKGSRYHRFEVYYWRERSQEVDYVLKKGNRLIGIEVKSGTHKPSSTKGMEQFQRKFQPRKIFMVGSEALPWQEFLLLDPITLF